MKVNSDITLKPLYFNITGPDGVGKDSIISLISKKINNLFLFREPGGTKESEIIRNILLGINEEERLMNFEVAFELDLLPLSRNYLEIAYDMYLNEPENLGQMETYLYAISRNETYEKIVDKKTKEGIAVLGSRSVACSMAYQGYARGIGFDFVWDINRPAIKKMPNFEIFLNTDDEILQKRLQGRTGKQDRLDLESLDFHKKTREGYLKYYREFCTYPYYQVDAGGTIEENANSVLNIIKKAAYN